MATDNQFDSSIPTKSPPRRSLVLFVYICTVSIAFYLLMLSLGIYRIETVGWGDGQSFSVDSDQYHCGIPAWLTYNEVSSSGVVPPLPDSDRAAQGFHFYWSSLAVAVLPALIIGSAFSFALIPVFRRIRFPQLALVLLSISVAMVISAFAGYYAFQENTTPVGIQVLFLTVPISVIVASCIHRSYLIAIFTSAFAITTVWWGFRISCIFRKPFRSSLPPDVELGTDGIALASGIVALSLIVCAFVFVGNILSKRRSAQSR
jgi:hypothetical protein